MKNTRNMLQEAAEKMQLPVDLISGIPYMELIGDCEFSLAPQRGLLEYADDHIIVDSSIGKVHILGNCLRIKLMNRERLAVTGKIYAVNLQEGAKQCRK